MYLHSKLTVIYYVKIRGEREQRTMLTYTTTVVTFAQKHHHHT